MSIKSIKTEAHIKLVKLLTKKIRREFGDELIVRNDYGDKKETKERIDDETCYISEGFTTSILRKFNVEEK